MSDNQIIELQKQIKNLQDRVLILERKINKTSSKSSKQDYSNIPGEEGIFDGTYMVTAAGKKFEVPANYSAKSKIVFGDTLKLIDEEGKEVFKHINKVPFQKLDAILTKKEGSWYALTELGTFRISDVAAEFQKAELNSKATVLVPSEMQNCSFATLDVVEGFSPAAKTKNKPSMAPPSSSKSKPKNNVVKNQNVAEKTTKPSEPRPTQVREKTSSILGDDDLM